MGELYERLLGQHPTKDKISTDGLQACIRLFINGTMSVQQISDLMAAHYGQALGNDPTGDNAGVTEAGDLVAWIPTIVTDVDRITRLERLAVIESVLCVVDLRQPPLNTPALVRAALGGRPDRS